MCSLGCGLVWFFLRTLAEVSALRQISWTDAWAVNEATRGWDPCKICRLSDSRRIWEHHRRESTGGFRGGFIPGGFPYFILQF